MPASVIPLLFNGNTFMDHNALGHHMLIVAERLENVFGRVRLIFMDGLSQ
jgi:hypothetical protein